MKQTVCQICMVLAFCVVILSGCASSPIRSSYSIDTPSLTEGTHLEKVWFDQSTLSSIRYSEIRLLSVRGIGVTDQTNITVVEAVQWLKEATVEPGKDPIVIQISTAGQVAYLELAITELNPGSTSARAWAGEFGAGHAWVQVEGKLFDAESNKLLCYFVERERKSGVATFRNVRGYDSGPGLINDMIADIGVKVRQEIITALNLQG